MAARPFLIPASWLGFFLLVSPALAAETAAIVEAVSDRVTGAQALDYLSPGAVIRLGASGTLVIDYLRSCKRETATGGTVTVGAMQSKIEGGKLESETVPCDGRRRHIEPSGEKAGSGPTFGPLLKPEGQPRETGIEWTLYGQSPLVDLGGPGRLTVERLDQPGGTIVVDVQAAQLLHGRFYDFAEAGKALTPGGTYRATFGNRRIVFWVDALADAGASPLAGRLLRL